MAGCGEIVGTRFRFRPSIVGALAALTVGFDASPRTGGDGRPGLQGPPAAGAVATAVVRVDVIVTDRQGAPVLNLSHGDFEVSDDGVRQALDSVELRRAGRQVGPSPRRFRPSNPRSTNGRKPAGKARACSRCSSTNTT